jgi:hypothetical protein
MLGIEGNAYTRAKIVMMAVRPALQAKLVFIQALLDRCTGK